MFIRIKKIKGKEYAYLVENTWRKRKQSSRQQVKAYLGKIIQLQKIGKTIPPPDIIQDNYSRALTKLMTWELQQQGFQEKEGKLILQEIQIDLESQKVQCQNKDVVLKINEGYLCSHTLKKAFQFQGEGYEEQVGVQLAETIVGLGLDIPQNLFVQLFEKIYKAPPEE